MALVAAPARQFKTYSMWVAIAIALIDAAILVAKQLGELQLVTGEHIAAQTFEHERCMRTGRCGIVVRQKLHR